MDHSLSYLMLKSQQEYFDLLMLMPFILTRDTRTTSP